MKTFRLAAPVLILVLAAGQVWAGAPATRGTMTHYTAMGPHPQTFVRMRRDPDEARVTLDTAAVAAIQPGDGLFEIQINFDDGPTDAWRAERDFEPKFEQILAVTNAHARLIATSLGKYRRSYYFVVREEDAPIVTAFQRVGQPPGGQLAVLRSNLETLDTLKPTAAELAGH